MKDSSVVVGKTGEQLAYELLAGKGYSILHQNFRYGRREIDIIAQQDNTIVFVEVRLRKNNRFGFPEQTVTTTKQNNIRAVAEHFLHTLQWKGNIRFDIIAITKNKTDLEMVHFEDAFA
ncbi:MAG: YraN family protein [Bacteroidetes bacterium]|nr:MAG: YraN family protein [Bacteroidota bacterium]